MVELTLNTDKKINVTLSQDQAINTNAQNNTETIDVKLSNEKAINTSLAQAKSVTTSVEDLNYIPAYREYEKERQENELERQAYFEELQERVENGEFVGKSLEYDWEDTKLGIRQEGQLEYEYVDLKGEKGKDGEGVEALSNIEIEALINTNIL